MTLPERVVELHRALARARIAHAFGGALALAFWTHEPRGTRDIDVNVFLPVSEAPRLLAALPTGVAQPDGTLEAITRDGQVRLWWEDVPIDLFFDYVPIHAEAAEHRQLVPFSGERIPVLGPVELAVFKAMFDRTRDWADVEAMVSAGTLDTGAVRSALVQMVPGDDGRFARLARAEELGRQDG